MTFAEVHGSPGERPRLAGLMRALWPVMVAFLLAGYLLRAAYPRPELPTTAVGVLLLLLALALAWAVQSMRLRFEGFLKGARGEETVGRILAFLPSDYRVFHGLSPAGAGAWGASPRQDFDHVVVGPTGIHLIETKSWRGRMTVEAGRLLCDGKPPDRAPMAQVRDAAHLLAATLATVMGRQLEIQPVICSALNTVVGGRTTLDGVIVCNAREVTMILREPGGERLSKEEVQAVAATLLDLENAN